MTPGPLAEAAPLRIMCLTNMYPGPADPDYGAFVATMVAALERRGHRVEPVTIDHRATGRLRTPAKYAALTGRALRAARSCDVVYAHYLFPTGAVAAAAGRAAGRPWVVTAHGRDVANLARPAVRRATSAGLAGCAGVIAVSRYLAERLRDSGLPLPPVHVADMGVDLDRFRITDRAAARGRLGLPGGVPLVLSVGGLTERKDPIGLLQAFRRVRIGHPEAVLALVGDGPLRGVVDAAVRGWGMERAVIRTGSLPHDRVADWMAACDVLSLVSRVEPLGIVALEALASGRPVVATAVGGAREVVPGRGPGRVVPPGDPARTAAALAELIASAPEPAACRAAAAGHSVARQAARVEAVLVGAVHARTTGRET